MALVREADGRGLRPITLKGILEELVGEIEDEHYLRPLELLLRATRRETKPAEPVATPIATPRTLPPKRLWDAVVMRFCAPTADWDTYGLPWSRSASSGFVA